MIPRRRRLLAIAGICAFTIVPLLLLGSRRPARATVHFIPAEAKVTRRVLPVKFGGGSRTTYIWRGSFADVVAAAKRELSPSSWHEARIGTNHVLFSGEGQLSILNGRSLETPDAVKNAKTKYDARATTWAEGGGYVSVVWDREDGSFFDHCGGLLYEWLKIGR